jgi:hypothetical protein
MHARTMELMLAGVSWDNRNGSKAAFWISDEDRDWFAMKTAAKGKIAGQRFAVAIVEIGDDELPKEDVTLQVKGPVPNPEPKAPSKSKFPDGLKGLSVRWCLDPDFQRWAHGEFFTDINEIGAKLAILGVCDIQSRSELESNDAAIAVFNKSIREPYMAHRAAEGLDD